MNDTLMEERELASIDEQIDSLMQTLTSKLAAEHKIGDVEADARSLRVLIETRKKKVEMLKRLRQ